MLWRRSAAGANANDREGPDARRRKCTWSAFVYATEIHPKYNRNTTEIQPRYTQNTTEIQRKCICICNRNTTERHLYMQRVRYAYTKIRLYLIVVSCPILGLFLGAFPKPDHRGFPLLAANTQPRRESCHSKKTRIPISPWRRKSVWRTTPTT